MLIRNEKGVGILDKIEKKVCFKYIIAVLLACVFALAFTCGCGGNNSKTNDDDTDYEEIDDGKLRLGYFYWEEDGILFAGDTHVTPRTPPSPPVDCRVAFTVDKKIPLTATEIEFEISYGYYGRNNASKYLDGSKGVITAHREASEDAVVLKEIDGEQLKNGKYQYSSVFRYKKGNRKRYERMFEHTETIKLPISLFSADSGYIAFDLDITKVEINAGVGGDYLSFYYTKTENHIELSEYKEIIFTNRSV